MSWEIHHKNPQNSLEPIKLLNESLYYDSNCFGSLSDLACRFASLGLFDISIYYAKRAVISEPAATLAWDNFNGIVQKFIDTLKTEELKKSHQNKIYHFLHDEFITERMKIPKLVHGDILVRVMNNPDFADSLYTKGEIRFVPTREYRETGDKARGDKGENRPIINTIVEDGAPITIDNQIVEHHIGGGKVTFGGTGKATIYSSKIEVGGMESVACFTLITKERVADFISNYDCEQFGNDAIVITNIQQFNHRVSQSLMVNGKSNVKHGAITYMNNDNLLAWNGILTPYLKELSYSPEMEYRFSYHHSTNPEIVNIGSIEDISIRIETNKLKQWVKSHFVDK